MNFVGIYNYNNLENYDILLYMWLSQLNENIPKEDRIFLICRYEEINEFLKNKIDSMDNVTILNMRMSIPNMVPEKHILFTKNIWGKLYCLSHLDFDFVFIDLDAIVVKPINLKKFRSKPFVAVNHERNVPKHTEHIPFSFMNSGFIIVNDADFLNWDKLIEHAIQNDFVFKYNGRTVPGTDQALLFSYCNNIGYDYLQENLGIEYNACASLNTVTSTEPARVVRGSEDIFIHHYWADFKPWNYGCPIFERYKEEWKKLA